MVHHVSLRYSVGLRLVDFDMAYYFVPWLSIVRKVLEGFDVVQYILAWQEVRAQHIVLLA